MKTRALLLALPALAILSCRDNRASVQIQAVCVPPDTCPKISATCDTQLIGPAYLDVTGPGRLTAFVQVADELPNNADLSAGRVNTNDAHVDQIEVEYGNLPLPRDVYPSLGWVPAGGTQVLAVDAVRPVGTNTALLQAYVAAGGLVDATAKIRLRGYYSDGSRFETGEFPLAMHVCSGCIPPCGTGTFACPAAGMEPAVCTTTK